jgi:hypothetical protein
MSWNKKDKELSVEQKCLSLKVGQANLGAYTLLTEVHRFTKTIALTSNSTKSRLRENLS